MTDEEDRGLVYDVETLLSRRAALGLFGALGAGALLAGYTGSPESGGSRGAAGSTGSRGSVTEVPDETGGPFPGDGSNGIDVLDDSGMVRSDITSTFGRAARTTAEGVPLTIRLIVREAATGRAKHGAAVYVWHCDRAGGYSLYGQGLENVNYLRGVQAADRSGTVTFTSIFPGCYPGRWPHIHFEVYDALEGATRDGPVLKTSQIALPRQACEAVYGTRGYEQSVGLLAQISLAGDNVFGDDGGIHQIASMTGSVGKGYVAALTVGV